MLLRSDHSQLTPAGRQALSTPPSTSPTVTRFLNHARILTKNSPETATAPHISVLGHITRAELLRYLDATESANGWANRFLWLCVKRSQVLPEGGRAPATELDGLGVCLSC